MRRKRAISFDVRQPYCNLNATTYQLRMGTGDATLPSMARAKTATPAETLRARLRSAGLRVTAPRVAVLQRLEAHGPSGPVTHGVLADELAPEGWDRATIYRNLIDLTEVGLIRRTDVGDHVWRFELLDRSAAGASAHEDREHAHFVCDRCGDVQCLPMESIKLDVGRGAPRSVRKHAVAIQLRGACDACEG